MDKLSPALRSANMAKVKGKNTKPEMRVRQALHALGYRFRLHRCDLPGRPDIVLPRLRTVIFVNGCYWHRHAGCSRTTTPTTNREFWQSKFDRTIERDLEQSAALKAAGWNVETIWECETRDQEALVGTLRRKLGR